MKRRAIQYVFESTLILILASWGAPAISRGGVDDSLYAELLKKYVTNGVVDYQGFKNEEDTLDRYLQVLAKTDTKTLSRNEQFAFYINAYNAWTIKLILTAYPGIKSIKDLGSLFRSPWKKKTVRLEGDLLSLDNVEHDILRPRFRDPRIHFAVNCASMSCPPLRSEPYRADILDDQLNEMTESFLNDSRYNRLEGNTLFVSSIFDWYSEDFDDEIVGFFMKYAKRDLKEKLRVQQEEINVQYLDYDWSLNGR